MNNSRKSSSTVYHSYCIYQFLSVVRRGQNGCPTGRGEQRITFIRTRLFGENLVIFRKSMKLKKRKKTTSIVEQSTLNSHNKNSRYLHRTNFNFRKDEHFFHWKNMTRRVINWEDSLKKSFQVELQTVICFQKNVYIRNKVHFQIDKLNHNDIYGLIILLLLIYEI